MLTWLPLELHLTELNAPRLGMCALIFFALQWALASLWMWHVWNIWHIIQWQINKKKLFQYQLPSGEVKHTDVCGVRAYYKIRLTHIEKDRVSFCFGEGQQLLDSALSQNIDTKMKSQTSWCVFMLKNTVSLWKNRPVVCVSGPCLVPQYRCSHYAQILFGSRKEMSLLYDTRCLQNGNFRNESQASGK